MVISFVLEFIWNMSFIVQVLIRKHCRKLIWKYSKDAIFTIVIHSIDQLFESIWCLCALKHQNSAQTLPHTLSLLSKNQLWVYSSFHHLSLLVGTVNSNSNRNMTFAIWTNRFLSIKRISIRHTCTFNVVQQLYRSHSVNSHNLKRFANKFSRTTDKGKRKRAQYDSEGCDSQCCDAYFVQR